MRFMILLKADNNTEAGVMPTAEMLSAMGKYNQQLIDAGVLVDGAGLQPTSKGARVRFSGKKRTVTDGPFAESKELLAGYWMFEVKSKDEAIEWVKKCPNPLDGEAEIEIRQVFELEDFPEVPEEVRAMDAKVRPKSGKAKGK